MTPATLPSPDFNIHRDIPSAFHLSIFALAFSTYASRSIIVFLPVLKLK